MRSGSARASLPRGHGLPLTALLMLAGCATQSRVTDRAHVVVETAPELRTPSAPVVEAVAGEAHVCARTRDGAVFCWGEGRLGQLGAAIDTSESPIWIAVPLALRLAVGAHTTCAVARDDRSLHCWGGLFLGAAQPSMRPTAMGIADVAAVDVHRSGGCALTRSGVLRCWNESGWIELPERAPIRSAAIFGDDVYALDGDGGWIVPPQRGAPERPPIAAERLAASAAGPWLVDRAGIAFAPRRSGSPDRALHFEPRPELGTVLELTALDGWMCARNDRSETVCVPTDREGSAIRLGISDMTRVEGGSTRVCASTDEDAVCFDPEAREGFRIAFRPGLGIEVRPLPGVGGEPARCGRGPIQAGVADLAIGSLHGCALLDDGTVRCWGGGGLAPAQFGVPAVPLRTDGPIADVFSDGLELCVLESSGRVGCMGPILGSGLSDSRHRFARPVELPMPEPITEISLGDDHGCARTERGTVACWTMVPRDRRPRTGGRPPPVALVSGLSGARDIDSAGHRTCVATDVAVVCMQPNGPLRAPQRVPGAPLRAVAIAVQDESACAIDEDGAVHCWGRNEEGQLGPRGGRGTEAPVRVDGLPPAERIVASDRSFCVLTREAREVWCWGHFAPGMGAPEIPRRLEIAAPARALAAGGDIACAVESAEGGVCCWGDESSWAIGRASRGGGYAAPAPIEW